MWLQHGPWHVPCSEYSSSGDCSHTMQGGRWGTSPTPLGWSLQSPPQNTRVQPGWDMEKGRSREAQTGVTGRGKRQNLRFLREEGQQKQIS